MIRFTVATITLTALISSFAFSQDSTPKVQAFAGYSYLNMRNGGATNGILDLELHQSTDAFGVESGFNGWSAEAQYNADRWVGIVADIGGRFGSTITGASGISGMPTGKAYSLLFGPVLSYRTKSRATPFVHALFGLDRTSMGASTITGPSAPVTAAAATYNDFAIAFGGGVDCKLSRRFAIRVGQVDFYHTSLNLNKFYGSVFGIGLFQGLPTHQDNVRLSAGVVVRF